MQGTEPTRRWTQLTRSLSAKLILLLVASMMLIFALLGYLNVRLHQQHLEEATLMSAGRVSDVIRRSAAYYMLRNDREGLNRTIQTLADEPGMAKVRIFDQDGRGRYSTDPSDKAFACEGCSASLLAASNVADRFRILRDPSGQRILRVITPIANQPACSNAACHAHSFNEPVLGFLDTDLSLAKADVQLAQSRNRTIIYTFAAMLVVAVLSWVFILRVVDKPIQALNSGTERLAQGELGYQIPVRSHDEVGDLARSFNSMSLQLREANELVVAWARTLEDRVEEKTRELKSAHEHVLHVEKMASVGKMAAVVAHEINNPLAGILTYAKLVKKWVDRNEMTGEKLQEAGRCLDLIASESRRCGDIVKNLLTFSRTSPMNVETTDLNSVVERAALLVQHQLDMTGIELHRDFATDLPMVQCDGAQIEQVLLALIMNAIDAMPRGGTLWLSTGIDLAREHVVLVVRDDGTGIPPEILPKIFEPFLTTKEGGNSVGLGLAVSRSIVERHGGCISVRSDFGKGTTFTVTLPLTSPAGAVATGEMEIMNAR